MKKLLLIFLTLISFGLVVNQTQAQEFSVSIDPPIFQFEADSPADISAPLTITNLSNQTVSYSIFLMPFKSSSTNNGEIEFDRTLLSVYDDFFSNVRIQDGENPITSLNLAPDEKKDLTLRIVIPPGERPKDYYFTTLFVSKDQLEEQPGTSTLTQGGIGSNVLVSIGPKSETKGIINEFIGPKFVTSGPVDFILSVFNNSDHFVVVDGNVTVSNMFGHKIGNIELLPLNILSNSDRFMESKNNFNLEPRVVFDEKFLVGYYTAEAYVALSVDGPILKKTFTFFAFPIEGILILAVISIVIIFIIQRTRRLKDNEA